MRCWGLGGLIGDTNDGGSGMGSAVPVTPLGLGSGATFVETGDHHTCAITTSGAVLCWGTNGDGELGDGTSMTRTWPVPVQGLDAGAVSLSLGTSHSCAIMIDGRVKCWGSNTLGQISGSLPFSRNLPPSDVFGLGSGVFALAAGHGSTCVIRGTPPNGSVYCWGAGIIGDGIEGQPRTGPPRLVQALQGISADVAVGSSHHLAVTADGRVMVWGYAGAALGLGPMAMDALLPVPVTAR